MASKLIKTKNKIRDMYGFPIEEMRCQAFGEVCKSKATWMACQNNTIGLCDTHMKEYAAQKDTVYKLNHNVVEREAFINACDGEESRIWRKN